jgi:hypothetical protein
MAISATYYLNGPSLGSSTTIYSNSSLTTIAPDGFYSDGFISREQVLGVLLPEVTCGSCATPCGGTIGGSGNQGIYLLNLDAGSTVSDVGAIIVRFDPFSFPDGIRATYNGNVYNKLSSPVDGAHSSSNPLGFTIVGDSDATGTCSSSWYPSGGSVVLDEFLYSGSSFSPTGNTQTITIASGDLSLNTLSPGNCILVIPKVSASPNIVNFEIIGPCGGTAFNISIACPTLLTGFSSSVVASTSEDVCDLSQTVTYYNASLANTPGTVGMYDFVYSDAYGASLLAAGFYKASGSIEGGNDWFEVDINGVVVDMGVCGSEPTGYKITKFVSNNSSQQVDCGMSTYIDFTETITVRLTENDGVTPKVNTTGSDIVVNMLVNFSGCFGDTNTYPSEVTIAPGQSETYIYNTGVTNNCGGIECTVVTDIYSCYTSITSGVVPDENFFPLCEGPVVTYNCISGNCIDPGDGTGTYATLVDCQANCGSSPSFSSTMTVGNGGASNVLWGYDRVDQNIGNMSDTNVSVPAGINSSLVTLRWADPGGGNLILRINNGNNSVAPNGWNSLNISGTNFSRNSGGSLVGNGLWQWVWMGVSANPFGTTVGATRAITLT